MFPLRPPFLNYPFNSFFMNNRRTPYYPYKSNLNRNNFIFSGVSANSAEQNSFTNNDDKFGIPVSNVALPFEKNEEIEEKDSFKEPFDDYFFEIFGLKLYFDDILIICLLFFLYEEGVNDQELFISLILLLLS